MKQLIAVFFVGLLIAGCAGGPAANLSSRKESTYPPVSPRIMTAENKLLDQTIFKLEEKKGKVILVNLWATWCGPCREEIPQLVEMQEKYKDQGFEVIGLDVDDETKEEIEAFTTKMKVNYTIGWAHDNVTIEISRMNKMNGIPQSILINRNGELTGIFRGGGANVLAKMKETVAKIVEE